MKAKLIAVIILSNIISAGILSADSHEVVLSDEDEVLRATQRWNGTANRGEWEEHHTFYGDGNTEFWQTGLIRNAVSDEKRREGSIRRLIEWNEKGGKRNIQLRHPEVTMHENFAIVTTLRHGSYTNTKQERRNVLDRVSIVWKKTEKGWKIVHSHYSDLVKETD